MIGTLHAQNKIYIKTKFYCMYCRYLHGVRLFALLLLIFLLSFSVPFHVPLFLESLLAPIQQWQITPTPRGSWANLVSCTSAVRPRSKFIRTVLHSLLLHFFYTKEIGGHLLTQLRLYLNTTQKHDPETLTES